MEQEQATEPRERPREALTLDQVREKLRQVALFQGLGSGDLEQILRASEPVLVEADEFVFEEGERGDQFFIIVRGEIELRKAAGPGVKRLAVLRAGQAFGEMALLNQTPRSASARAVEDTYMLSLSRAAFGEILGGDTLAVRLLRNLSKALWATSVRLAAKQAEHHRSDTPHEALAEFNRLLRARLLPRLTPRITGYDVTAATQAPRRGVGSSAWDWFVLRDGRPAFLISRAARADIFSAQRLTTVRTLFRSTASDPHATLGSAFEQVNRGLKGGWVDGLSGPVYCALVAISERSAECVVTRGVTGVVIRRDGFTEDLSGAGLAVGEEADESYDSVRVPLAAKDRIVLLSEKPRDRLDLVSSVLLKGYAASSRAALTSLFDRLGAATARGVPGSDLSGVVVTSTRSP